MLILRREYPPSIAFHGCLSGFPQGKDSKESFSPKLWVIPNQALTSKKNKNWLVATRLLDAEGNPKYGFHHLGMHDVENITRCLVHLLETDVELKASQNRQKGNTWLRQDALVFSSLCPKRINL